MMIPYEPHFYDKAKADSLLEFASALPHHRKKNPRNGTSSLRRLSYPGWSVSYETSRNRTAYEVSPFAEAPHEYLDLAARISDYAGKEINYLSTIGYEDERDHMNWHQHKEDKSRDDQSVYVLSLGEERLVGIRVKGDKNKDNWDRFYPKHGSLYVLPSSFNITHEHAVLEDPYPRDLRIGINCKHIPESLIIPPQGQFVREPGPPRIYSVKDGKFPKEAVYVGRAFREWPDTPFGNYKRLNGDEWKAEVARLMAQPEFPALVEGLRGKDLLCWCGPKEEARCHARAWLELANA